MRLEGNYNFKETEKKILEYWRENKIYKFDEKSRKPIYSIDTPPPTVSGRMHLGHTFSYSQQDFIARYKRMRGYNLFFPFGTDDNGLATEILIEKLKNVKAEDMKRDAFIRLCLETLNEIRPDFIQDWKNIGFSSDYDLFYSTINDHCRKISQLSFIDLYKNGRIYRKKSPIIFCPNCKTAIAQVEMEDSEKETFLVYIKAKTETGEYVTYATTRPELHPGCVGISIDKDEVYVIAELEKTKEKWIISKDAVTKFNKDFPMKIIKKFKGKNLIGKKVQIPFANREVSFSHDQSAKTEYGSGVVYYCTYGGLDCVEWMARHPEIKPIEIMDESGKYITGPYKGLNSTEARRVIIQDLEKNGFLVKREKIKHVVNIHERCGTDIEYIATVQWFIRYLDLKKLFLDAGKKLNWYPKHMEERYGNWIKGLQWDWCISRQRYFGVPFPVWYCKKCKEVILADENKLPVDPLIDKLTKKCKCGSNQFIPEPDVLDTWATSSLTPKIAAELRPNIKKIYPMNLRPQAYDIINFWLFYTLVKSQMHDQVNPWKDVVISGHVLDPTTGEKMSKSKGKPVSPQDLLIKYGADAIRFWTSISKLGDDMSYQEKDIVTGQKTVTKLWNASKFISQHLIDFKDKPKNLEEIDKFILSKLTKIVKSCTESFEKYEYSRAKFEIENFFWNLFCDYYLEIVKDRVYNPQIMGEEKRRSAQFTLKVCLNVILKLFAPIMPFITEELYLHLFAKEEEQNSIHLSEWPKFNKKRIDEKIEKKGERFIEILKAVRQFKSQNSKSLKAEINLCLDKKDEKLLKDMVEDLRSTVNARTIDFGEFSISFVE